MANKYIRSYSKALLVLCLFVATCVQAQQFRTSAGSTTVGTPAPVGGSTYSNPMLQPRSTSPASLPVTRTRNTSVGGQVYSDGIFKEKYNRGPISIGGGGSSSGGGAISGGSIGGSKGNLGGSVRTFTSISSYQSISAASINAASPTAKGGGGITPPVGVTPPPPPPPTPDPNTDDPTHQLPIGDAAWFALLLAIGYGVYRRKTASR